MRKPTPDIKYLDPALVNRIGDKNALDSYLRRDNVIEDSLATLFFGNQDLHKSIRGLVNFLPVAERELLKMRYWQDLTIEEISKSMGVGESDIQKTLIKILAKLRPLVLKEISLITKKKEYGRELQTADQA
jgi:DNA-directed RNA polymerase specialized sigma24 family protein